MIAFFPAALFGTISVAILAGVTRDWSYILAAPAIASLFAFATALLLVRRRNYN